MLVLGALYYVLIVLDFKENALQVADGYLYSSQKGGQEQEQEQQPQEQKASVTIAQQPEVPPTAIAAAVESRAVHALNAKNQPFIPPQPITNKLPSCLDLAVGRHERTTVGDPLKGKAQGQPNVTSLAVFNKDQKGVRPSNHSLFEAPAEFGSDVTNINQFYRLNQDQFQRTIGSEGMKTVSDWEAQANQMINEINFSVENVTAFNNEADFGAKLA